MGQGFAGGDAWQEIDLDALRWNFAQVKALAAPAAVAAVVKADAYGHGMAACAQVFAEAGADVLAVSSLREALALRRRLPAAAVWAMGAPARAFWAEAIQAGIAMTVGSLAEARALSGCAVGIGGTALVHLKVDTGFHRLGMAPEEAARAAGELARQPGLRMAGVFTHLALLDEAHDTAQVEAFSMTCAALARQGLTPPRHVADSIALARYPAWRYDMVRAGAVLYGMKCAQTPFAPRRAMRLCGRVAALREIAPGEGVGYDALFVAERPTRIATVPLGYADGLPRRLWRRGEAALRGRRAPYAGLPCMDMVTLDVTDVPGVSLGDVVTFLGGEGPDAVPLEDFAAWAETNRNEPLAMTGRRVPRVFLERGMITGVDDPLLGNIEMQDAQVHPARFS
jgi:alanine racemase